MYAVRLLGLRGASGAHTRWDADQNLTIEKICLEIPDCSAGLVRPIKVKKIIIIIINRELCGTSGFIEQE